MSIEDVIKDELWYFNELIKDRLTQKGINDTKEAYNSLRVISSKNSVSSVGSEHIEFLDRGRGPNRDQSPQALINWSLWYGENVLKPWAERKGIIFGSYFGLAYHIATTGNGIYKNKSKGLELDELIDDFKISLRKRISIFAVEDVKKQLNFFSNQKI